MFTTLLVHASRRKAPKTVDLDFRHHPEYHQSFGSSISEIASEVDADGDRFDDLAGFTPRRSPSRCQSRAVYLSTRLSVEILHSMTSPTKGGRSWEEWSIDPGMLYFGLSQGYVWNCILHLPFVI